MAGNKTRDGLRISELLKLATQAGARVREGNSHAYILNYGMLRPCPLATSTDAGRMLAPWLAQVTGRSRYETYEAMRRGEW
jgi:hypothetical protein